MKCTVEYMFFLIVAAAVANAIGEETNCVSSMAAINDDTSLLQIESSIALGSQTARMHTSTAEAHASSRNATILDSILSTIASVNPVKSPYMGNASDNLGPFFILLDTCPDNELMVTLTALGINLILLIVSALLIPMVKEFDEEQDTTREKFHASRIAPWIYLCVIAMASIPLTLNRMWSEKVAWSHIVTLCVPIFPQLVVTQFGLLLLYDLVWEVFVFGSVLKKPLFIVHHLGLLIWCLLTLYDSVGYMNLITIIIGLGEVPELIASVSYLNKDTKHARWWMRFTTCARMCCSTYAMGCTIVFVLLGYSKWGLKAFLFLCMVFWCAYVVQEWGKLQGMCTGKTKKKPEEGMSTEGTSRAKMDKAREAREKMGKGQEAGAAKN